MDWLGLIGSLAGSLGLSGLNHDINERHRAEDRDFAMQMAQYQNDVGLQNWRMQAGYNSPASQMQRFREAGLNPDLAYGQMHSEVPLQSGAGQGLSQGSQYQFDPMMVANVRLANAQAQSIEDDNERKGELHKYDLENSRAVANLATGQSRLFNETYDSLKKINEKTAEQLENETNISKRQAVEAAIMMSLMVDPVSGEVDPDYIASIKDGWIAQKYNAKLAKQAYELNEATQKNQAEFDKWVAENKDSNWFAGALWWLKGISSYTPDFRLPMIAIGGRKTNVIMPNGLNGN